MKQLAATVLALTLAIPSLSFAGAGQRSGSPIVVQKPGIPIKVKMRVVAEDGNEVAAVLGKLVSKGAQTARYIGQDYHYDVVLDSIDTEPGENQPDQASMIALGRVVTRPDPAEVGILHRVRSGQVVPRHAYR